jgi:YQGE family putative transporter
VLLLESSGLCNAALSLSSVFVALFFYVTSGSVAGMAYYSIGRYLGLIVMSAVIVAWLPAVAPRRLFRVGLGCTAVFYGALIVVGGAAGHLALPLGLVNGAASGVYWFGNGTLVYDVVSAGERGRYYGFSFALGSVLNVLMPLASGAIIAGIGGKTGYFVVFGLALIAFLGAWARARQLDETAAVGGRSLREAFLLPFSMPRWGRAFLVMAMRGFKQTAGSLGLITLVYLAAKSPAAQGDYVAISSAAGVATSVLAGHLPMRLRAVGIWIGAAGFAGATMLLLGHLDLGLVLVYGAVTGLVYPGVMVPVASIVLETIDEDPAGRERRGAYILSREWAANLGRLAAAGLLLGLISLVPTRLAVLTTLGVAAALQLVIAGLVARGEVLRRLLQWGVTLYRTPSAED